MKKKIKKIKKKVFLGSIDLCLDQKKIRKGGGVCLRGKNRKKERTRSAMAKNINGSSNNG